MPSIYPCPKCGEFHFHKSHTRNLYERLRKVIFNQRIYRCHKCGYRGWGRYKVINRTISPKKILLYVLVLFISVFFSFIIKAYLL